MTPVEPRPMKVFEEAHPSGFSLLRVSGEVDMNSSIRLRRALKGLVDGGARGVIVTLSEVAYMDSSGVAVLIEGYKWCMETHLPFCLAEVSRSVRKVLELAHLTSILKVVDDLDAAVATCETQAT